jgi:asparagine synthase (glutamine-hydrolysing)
MCGICGKVEFTSTSVDPALIDRMCSTLIHRGPDAQGIHTADRIGLGQRRLSIIDLSERSVAPLSNEDGSIWVTFNGEIYNFRELRAELEQRGHRFKTGTDTEVIVHLYEDYGAGCVARLRGMFALAIWDGPRRQLFAARDRLGKKPFYWTKTATSLLFASEIKALLVDPGVSAEPDYAAIDDYLTYQYVPSPRTAFRNVQKLPAGHTLTCRGDGTVDVARYWRPSLPEKTRASAEDIEQELAERLDDAVRARLISDVPLGAFLSGGVDSSAVVALMARHSPKPVQTFSIGFDDQAYNELPVARKVAKRYGTDHHELVVHPDAVDLLPRLVWHYNEPFADSSALPTFYVSRFAREHVTVALSGDGGDESFAGYDNYGVVNAWGRADRIPAGPRKALGSGVAGLLDRLPYDNRVARISRGWSMLGGSLPDRFRLQSTVFKPQEKAAAYTSEFRSLIESSAPPAFTPASLPWSEEVDPFDWMMWHDQHFYLPDCLMVKTDVASMANSLEVRCPLLDHPLVEFAASIPSGLKRDEHGSKLIFKRALARLLPQEVLAKRKTGFGVPLRTWFAGPLSGFLRDTLLDGRTGRRNLFDPAFLRKLVEDQTSGRRDWSQRLWALLFLELWFRQFID